VKTKLVTGKNKFFLFIISFLVFLSCYFSTLVRLNLRLNLQEVNRGSFDCIFGKTFTFKGDLIEKGDKIFLLLFLLYFPGKILVDFLINFGKEFLKEGVKIKL